MKNFVSILSHILLRKPVLSFAILVFLLAISIHQSRKLTINSNQIDLLPPNEIEVVKTKDIIEMIGGNGFFIVALRLKDEKGRDSHVLKALEYKKKGDLENSKKEFDLADKIKSENLEYYDLQEKKIKDTSDILYQELIKVNSIRYISYKYKIDFLQDKLPFFITPTDLNEIRSRVRKKIDEEIDKKNPFYISLGEEYNPDFTDIMNRYQRLAKRDIFDEYNISSSKAMLLLLVKPEGSFTDLNRTRELQEKIAKVVENLKIEENGIDVSFSGSYKLNLDDYDSLVDALKPISIASLVLITILLFLFFRNPIFILILVISLLSGITFTFGLTGFLIGRLNTITTIMAAVLMGLGVDYGIQFLYRFKEEFSIRENFLESVTETIYHTGTASLISAFTTTSAFVVLMFSDFRGFSEFGLIACYGIILIAISMYFITAIQIAVLFRFFPSTKKYFNVVDNSKRESHLAYKFFKNPRFVLKVSIIVIILISIFAFRVSFNYSGRDLLLENQESLLVYDEIGDRFDVSSDPQAIVADSLEKSEAIFDFFTPVREDMVNSVDQVISIWSLIPPENQFQYNQHILKKIKEDIKIIKPDMIEEKYKPFVPKAQKYISATKFYYEDVPEMFTKQFTEVPTSKKKGHMVFIYPKVALWHGKDLRSFYDKVGKFEYPLISKRTLNSILYSSGKINLDEEHPEHFLAKYSKSEEQIILDYSNILSKNELESIGLLPETASLIVSKRPFESIEQMRNIKETAYTAGSVILFAKLAMIVQREALPSILFTLGIVFLILILFYRGFVPAVLSLIPLMVGLVVMLGIMGIFNAKINFFNICVFPIVIGYGIQNGIYIYYRYLEEKNIADTISKIGPAIIASTLTTLVGWGVLLLAEHRGLHSVGLVACIGIGSSLLVALTLLPSMLDLVYKKKYEPTETDIGLNVDITNLSELEKEKIHEETTPDEVKEISKSKLEINEIISKKKKPSLKKKAMKFSKKNDS